MSQLISATPSLPRAPTAKAEPTGEPASEATETGDGFAALLAGLFALPVATPPAMEPAKPILLKGAAPIDAVAPDALPDDALADHGTAGRPADGNGDQQQPFGSNAAAPSIAAPGIVPDGTDPVTNAEAPIAMPPRGKMDPLAEQPPADSKPAVGPSGELKAGATTGGPPSLVAPAAPPAERRHGDLRATSERSAAPAAALGHAGAAGRDVGAPAGRLTLPGAARSAAPVDQRGILSPVASLGRLGLAWQADLADLGAGVPSTGLLAAEGIAGGVERSAVAIAEQPTGGTVRLVQQIALAIDRAVNGEIRQLTIQLSPRELGTIEIAIELDADRRLTVAVLAERPETLDLLRQDSRQLERLLGQQGLSLAEAGLDFGLMSQERREGRERPMPAALNMAAPDEAEGHGDAGPAHPPPTLGTAQRLNLSI